MAKRQFVTVAPALLRWARESAGLAVELAAKRIGTTGGRDREWEDGTTKPTATQLREAARVYKRPLAAFFLPDVPSEPALPHDFRRVHGADVAPMSSELLAELRRARRRRVLALELMSDVTTEIAAFPLSARLEDDTEQVGADARRWLGVELGVQETWDGMYDSLNGWIAALEARNVLVFQTGDVDPDEMRGLSLSESILPAIVLNGKDAPRARVFTLMHELGHLMLHEGGLCDPVRTAATPRSLEERIETFCNRVAGAALVPRDALLEDSRVRSVTRSTEWTDDTIRKLADRFAVSREVVLRRLLLFERTTPAFYQRKREEYQAAYFASLARERENRKPGDGGPSVSVMTVRDNGRRYTRLVLEALRRDQISYADVSDYLGVRLKHLEAIASAVQGSGERRDE